MSFSQLAQLWYVEADGNLYTTSKHFITYFTIFVQNINLITQLLKYKVKKIFLKNKDNNYIVTCNSKI